MEQANENQEQLRWAPQIGFREHFAKRREVFLSSFAGAVQSFDSVICRPIDGSFWIGWRMEQGDTEHPWKEQGALDFGLAYLRHMIDQGFHVAYAVSEAEGGLVHLKAWEEMTEADEYEPIEENESDDYKEPSWPDDNEIIMFARWEPMQVRR